MKKKTLKKGRRGWVISAAIVVLLGISAGTVVLQNQSSQNQGQCESVTVSDSSSKEKEYTTTDTIKETEKSFLPKVDAKEELAKAFVATKKVGSEDSIKSLDKSYEKLSEITKVEEKLKSQVRTEGEDAVEQVSRLEVANKDNKILEKSGNLTEKVEVNINPSFEVKDDKGIPAVQPQLQELVVSEKGTPEVQEKLPEAKPEKDKVLDKKGREKKKLRLNQQLLLLQKIKIKQLVNQLKKKKTLDEKKDKVENNQANLPGDKGQVETGKTTTVVGETTKEEVVKPAVPGKPEVPAKPAENGKPAVEAQPAVPSQPEVKKTITTRTEVETSVIEPGVQHVPDANLNVGETKVVQEGVAGKTETTYTITIENGVEVSRTATGTQTTPAVDKVIHVGTKTSKEVVRTTKEEMVRTPILPGTEYVPDENLDAGVEKEVESGKNGEKLEVYTVTLEDGVETGRTLVLLLKKKLKTELSMLEQKLLRKTLKL